MKFNFFRAFLFTLSFFQTDSSTFYGQHYGFFKNIIQYVFFFNFLVYIKFILILLYLKEVYHLNYHPFVQMFVKYSNGIPMTLKKYKCGL